MTPSRNRIKCATLKVPPTGFLHIDSEICRGLTPITRQNMNFLLHDMRVSTVINVSNDTLNIASLSVGHDIIVHNLNHGEEFLYMSVANAEDFVKKAVELILSCPNVLILGSQQHSTHVDMVLVAVLRRLQGWTLTSVLSELRTCIGKSLFDVEQFIEYFDMDLIDLPPSLPDCLLSYESILEEESAIMDQIRAYKTGKEPAEESSGLILAETLLFAENQQLLLPGTVFDASVSLITEDVED